MGGPVISAWSFHNPVRIRFGRGVRAELTKELSGCRCLIVTTKRGRRQLMEDGCLGEFARREEHVWVDSVTENPGLHQLQSELNRLADQPFDAIVAFGGGSAVDAAKVLAVGLSERCRDTALKELLQEPALHARAIPKPLYALPTTSGTGSEVTPFATVWDHDERKKHSLAGPAVFPHAAYVDPALTDALPQGPTLSTGLDAINQAAESIWNNNATPLTLSLATRALKLGFVALPALVDRTGGEAERDHMAEASLLAGLAISQTRTALCHSISYPITAHFDVPHGLACAFTMPAVLRHNLTADDGRFVQLAQALCGADAGHEELIAKFDGLFGALRVRERVQDHVPSFDALTGLSDGMHTPGRADNSLAPADSAIVEGLLRQAWEHP